MTPNPVSRAAPAPVLHGLDEADGAFCFAVDWGCKPPPSPMPSSVLQQACSISLGHTALNAGAGPLLVTPDYKNGTTNPPSATLTYSGRPGFKAPDRNDMHRSAKQHCSGLMIPLTCGCGSIKWDSGTNAIGNANPAAPAARNLSNYHGTWENFPFMHRTFEWGVVIAAFLSVLSVVPCHCARLTYLLHPKPRKINDKHPTANSPSPAARRKHSPWAAEQAHRKPCRGLPWTKARTIPMNRRKDGQCCRMSRTAGNRALHTVMGLVSRGTGPSQATSASVTRGGLHQPSDT